jgi:hypothetical protein
MHNEKVENQQSIMGLTTAAQEVPLWDKCSIEQKIERLRQEAINARRNQGWQAERINRTDNQVHRLDNHQHGADGTVLIRPRDAERLYAEVGQGIGGGYDPLA